MASRKPQPRKSLAEFSPHVAAMANGWDPTKVSSHSKKKLEWICNFGHIWQCIVGDMTAKNLGCPYCSGQRTLSGFNDLSTKFPEIALQAHGWDPTTVTPHSGKKMEWKCKNGHVSTAQISSRTAGNGCPYCSGSKTLAGFNDLTTTHPQLATQAHGWDPHNYSKGSNYLAEWICMHGHVWKTVISDRTSKNIGCPYCSGKRALAGFNDLTTTHPQLATQAHGWDPTTVTKGSGKVKEWRCGSGHVFKMIIQERTDRGLGCQYCSGKQVLRGFNDLVTVEPEIAAQAHGWDPTTVTKGSKQIKKWKCKEGHIYRSQIQSQTRGGSCPVCSGHQIIIGSNDLATVAPGVAAQAHGWDPTTVTVSSGRKMPWICPLGHTWNATVASRSNHTSNCPTCSGKQVLKGFNDLATIEPEIAKQANGWDPTTVTKGSKQIKEWKCDEGHLWNSATYRRTGPERSGCPTCSSHTVLVGFNDLESKFPVIGRQAYGWDPTTVTAGSNERREWICEYGHRWSAVVTSRTNLKSGCPVCIGRKVLVGFNDLATTDPELAAQADGWNPTTVTFGSNKKVGWICELGHKWEAAVADRTSGRGCPSCATSGFDPNKPSFVYLIDHFDLHMFQIGITNFPDDRLDSHKRRGWEVIELRGPMDGHLTQKLETDCLHALEKRGAILGHKAGIEKFDGYTEAWTKKSLNVTSIKQILDWVYEDEAK